MDRSEIRKQLEENVCRAKQRLDRASARFDEVMNAVPSGIPYPDNIEQINAASREYEFALFAVTKALRVQGEFILDGIIPPEFAALENFDGPLQ
jgi:hypothetical protein